MFGYKRCMRLKLTSLPQGRQVVERFKKVDPRGGCGGGGRMEKKNYQMSVILLYYDVRKRL